MSNTQLRTHFYHSMLIVRWFSVMFLITGMLSACITGYSTKPVIDDDTKNTQWDSLFNPTHEVQSPPNQRILFVSHTGVDRSNYDIWQACLDGSNASPILPLDNQQDQFSLSPNGKYLAYINRGEQRHIWMVDLTLPLLSPINLTDNTASYSAPKWSPDGKVLAYFSTRDHKKPELYFMTISDKKSYRITYNDYYDSGVSWHPNKNKIILTRYFPSGENKKYSGAGEIIEVTFNEHFHPIGEKQLSELGGYNSGVAYSPNGAQIAFHRTLNESSEIWTMNSNGDAKTAITHTSFDEYSPSWSSDGNWILFTSGNGNDSQGLFDLWVMKSDGSRQKKAFSLPNTQMSPQWHPDSKSCND